MVSVRNHCARAVPPLLKWLVHTSHLQLDGDKRLPGWIVCELPVSLKEREEFLDEGEGKEGGRKVRGSSLWDM